MKVLKATQEQYNLLNGVGQKDWYIGFQKDNFNNWVTAVECRGDEKYPDWALVILDQLEEIEYVPIPQEDDSM